MNPAKFLMLMGLAVLSAGVSPSTADGTFASNTTSNSTVTSSSVTVTAAGGSGVRTYSWSCTNGVAADSPTSATTTFSKSVATVSTTNSVATCTITDTVTGEVTTVQVNVTLTSAWEPLGWFYQRDISQGVLQQNQFAWSVHGATPATDTGSWAVQPVSGGNGPGYPYGGSNPGYVFSLDVISVTGNGTLNSSGMNSATGEFNMNVTVTVPGSSVQVVLDITVSEPVSGLSSTDRQTFNFANV